VDEETAGNEETYTCGAVGIRGCSRNRLGAYLLFSESLPSSLIEPAMIAPYAQLSDLIIFYLRLD
jgi:hypothetical protein